jgi:competence protein ComEA
MCALKKTILLLCSLTLFVFPLTLLSKEEVKKVEKVSTEVEEVDTVEEEVAAEEIEKVDINTALAETLASKLDGIGPKKAEAIVKFREEHGLFKEVIELLQVEGIGEKTLEKNKDKLTVSLPEESADEETSTDEKQ